MAKRKFLSLAQIKLLRKAKRHILKEPKRFIMGVWREDGIPGDKIHVPRTIANAGSQYEYGSNFPKCGTAACIGGWMETLDWKVYQSIMYKGMSLTGRWRHLFHAAYWGKYSSEYAKAKTPTKRTQIAARVIEYFIKHDGLLPDDKRL